MNELRALLQSLGWSADLIRASTEDDGEPGAVVTERLETVELAVKISDNIEFDSFSSVQLSDGTEL